MFKSLVGRGHQDFSTSTQQDAQEYFLHVINVLGKHSRHEANPSDALKFRIEDRVECGSSGAVKYTYRDEWCLPLTIPLLAATNQAEVRAYEARREEAERAGLKLEPNDLVRPKIPLAACLENFAAVETVEQFFSSAVNALTFAKKTARLATMPDYLMLQLKKFTIREDWTEVKLDVAVEIPDTLDLNDLRGVGLKAGETELPELAVKPPSPPPADPVAMQQLQEMGFPTEACKRALFFTKNSGLELATQWMMEHMDDSDFGDPFIPPGLETRRDDFVPNAEGVMMLTSMGFTETQATKALKETNNNTERAVDWIFSHQDELNAVEQPMDQSPVAPVENASNYRDGAASKCQFISQLFVLHAKFCRLS